jgi:hypothetical protein
MARGQLQPPEVLPYAIAALERLLAKPKDEEGGTRRLACELLGEYPDPKAIPVLLKALDDPYLHMTLDHVPGVGGAHVEWSAVWRDADRALRRITKANPVPEARQREPIPGQQKAFCQAWQRWWRKHRSQYESREEAAPGAQRLKE